MAFHALFLLVASIGLASCAASAPSPRPADGTEPGRVAGDSVAKVSVKGDPRLGNRAAVIGIVEFSDYQCSYCRNFHRQQFARIKKEYIDTGVVQFIHKDLPLRTHAQAWPAAMAAGCADRQGRFWEMHDALFENQDRLEARLYAQLARQLNLDHAKFETCFQGQAAGREIRQDAGAARELGLTGTPSFLIGKIEGDTLTVVRLSRGAPDFEKFAQEIERLR